MFRVQITFSPEDIFLLLADTAEQNQAVYKFAGLHTDAAEARMDAIRYRRQAESAAKEARRPINRRRGPIPKISLRHYLTPDLVAPHHFSAEETMAGSISGVVRTDADTVDAQ